MIYKILQELRATSSRLEKEAILKKNAKNDLLKQVVFLALDPYTQFYQRKIPDYKPAKKNQADTLGPVLDSLLSLSSRQVTGNAAIEYLTKLLSSLTADDAKVLECVIQKDLDCGVQSCTANKIWEDLVPDYPCMLASGYEEKLVEKIQFPAFVQLKMDGMRFNAIVDANDKRVVYRSRNGKIVEVNTDLLDAAFLEMAKNIGMANVVFDGELVVVDDAGKLLDRKTGNGILNKANKGTISVKEAALVHASVWDLIPYEAFVNGKCTVPYAKRFSTLEQVVNKQSSENKKIWMVASNIVQTIDEAQVIFQDYLSKGYEGIILKDGNGIWEDKRAKHQIKFKGELECDLLCVDWQEGTGKNVGRLGALVLQSADNVINVNVGSGFTDEQRDKYTKMNTVGKIVAVKYNARIRDKKTNQESLFLPVFLELREDKDVADSSTTIK